jgi:hypothetical protein
MERIQTALYIVGAVAGLLVVCLGLFIILFESITAILKKIWKE